MPGPGEAEDEQVRAERARTNAMRQLAQAVELLAAVEASKTGVKPEAVQSWLEAYRQPGSKRGPKPE